jgi:hypothetical protein
MKIFGMQFGKKSKPVVQSVSDYNGYRSMAYSTSFTPLPTGNLSLPYVNDYYTASGYVLFGVDNLYPQLLNQMYYSSPLHGAIVDFIHGATIGGGWEWDTKQTGKSLIDTLTFEKTNKLKKLFGHLTRDFIIHRRVTVLIKNINGRIFYERLDPSSIRNSGDGQYYVYSKDWSRGRIEALNYPKWHVGTQAPVSLFVYQDDTPGQDIYPIPRYNSILNWVALDSEIAFLQKANIQNSVFPSMVIRRPKEFASVDELEMFRRQIADSSGAGNAGRILVLTGVTRDDLPEFQKVEPNSNDALFDGVAKELKNQICFAWSINPAIMGIKVEGSLGNSQELEMSYAIFEKNIIKPLRAEMTDIFTQLLLAGGIINTITINDFQIIEKTIEDTTI